jgi:hypothetical protein
MRMARRAPPMMIVTVVLLAAAPAAGQIPGPRTDGGFGLPDRAPALLVNHQPTGFGGPAADTEFINMFGQPSWQLLADDIVLSEPAVVQRVKWWGFYHLDNPPAQEQMRVRFYDARPGDGLPGQVQYEATIANPARLWTGRRIPVSVNPREFLFDVLLAEAFTLRENTLYWLEIVQLADIETHYRWEASIGGNRRFAFTHPSFPNWSLATNHDLAFQLLGVPEPATATLLFVGLLVPYRRGGTRKPSGKTIR